MSSSLILYGSFPLSFTCQPAQHLPSLCKRIRDESMLGLMGTYSKSKFPRCILLRSLCGTLRDTAFRLSLLWTCLQELARASASSFPLLLLLSELLCTGKHRILVLGGGAEHQGRLVKRQTWSKSCLFPLQVFDLVL